MKKADEVALREEVRALRSELRAMMRRGVVPQVAPPKKQQPQRKHTPDEWDPKWKTVKKVCPRCGDKKCVDPDFGVRFVKGVQRAQPYCRKCRSNLNYYNMPRKNRSRNNPDGEFTGTLNGKP